MLRIKSKKNVKKLNAAILLQLKNFEFQIRDFLRTMSLTLLKKMSVLYMTGFIIRHAIIHIKWTV